MCAIEVFVNVSENKKKKPSSEANRSASNESILKTYIAEEVKSLEKNEDGEEGAIIQEANRRSQETRLTMSSTVRGLYCEQKERHNVEAKFGSNI